MSALLAKLKQARESQVKAGLYTFTIRRPTDYEAAILENTPPLDVLKRFVIDWDVKELDIIPGGSPEPAAFDAETFGAWVEDHLDLWPELVGAISNAYQAHIAAKAEALGKPEAG